MRRAAGLILLLSACAVEEPDPGVDADAGPPTCEAWSCDFEAENSSMVSSFAGHYRFRQERDGEDRLVDRLELRIRHGGAYQGAKGPGTYDLTGSIYAECETCALIGLGCADDSDASCEAVFLATAGNLVLEEWSDSRFTGRLVDARLVEVNVHNPIAVMPKLGGRSWLLDDHAFEQEITVAEAPIRAETDCVAQGTGVYLGHQLANLTLNNCHGDPVTLHDSCGQGKVLRIMASTGWCTACGLQLNSLAADYGGTLSRAAMAAQTPGLDMLVVLSEDAEHEKATPAYCLSYAEAHHLDPAMVLLDYSDEPVSIPLVPPLGGAMAADSNAQLWSTMNPYLARDADGRVLIQYPWQAVIQPKNMVYYWSSKVGVGELDEVIEGLLAAP